jgi:hypothetical protein
MTISTESFIFVNEGASANDGTGDSLRAAFVKVNKNFANIENIGFDTGNIYVGGFIEVAGNVIVSNVYVPTANTSSGNIGQITWDSDYLYICVGTDSWKRANLVAW